MFSLEKNIKIAEKYLKNGELNQAEKSYKSIVRMYPKNLRAFNGLEKINEIKKNLDDKSINRRRIAFS